MSNIYYICHNVYIHDIKSVLEGCPFLESQAKSHRQKCFLHHAPVAGSSCDAEGLHISIISKHDSLYAAMHHCFNICRLVQNQRSICYYLLPGCSPYTTLRLLQKIRCNASWKYLFIYSMPHGSRAFWFEYFIVARHRIAAQNTQGYAVGLFY